MSKTIEIDKVFDRVSANIVGIESLYGRLFLATQEAVYELKGNKFIQLELVKMESEK